MPPQKKAQRPTRPKRAQSGSTPGVHPLGKLFFALLAIALLAIATMWFIEKPESASTPPPPKPRAVANTMELQIALARTGFSPGSIDGKDGGQTQLALLAYQTTHHLPASGTFDAATAAHLKIQDPVFARVELTERDFKQVAAKPQTWIERGQLDAMHYNSILEMVAEHAQTAPDTVRQLNPNLNWQSLQPGDQLLVPHLPVFRIKAPIADVRIQLSKRILQAYDSSGRIQFHCPVSIARNVNKRPSGQLAVKVRVANPNYTFNPAILTGTAQREGITQKFIIQPGPNNPVGSVWIGLNLPSYGIHGTPEPEKVGRTESSGCFRLANWNAEALLHASWVGMPVQVDP